MDQHLFNIVVAAAAVIIALSFVIQAFVFLRISSSLRNLVKIGKDIQSKIEPVLS